MIQLVIINLILLRDLEIMQVNIVVWLILLLIELNYGMVQMQLFLQKIIKTGYQLIKKQEY